MVHGKANHPWIYVEFKSGVRDWAPLSAVMKDEPMMMAKYILDNDLKAPFKPQWAKKTYKKVRRLYNLSLIHI